MSNAKVLWLASWYPSDKDFLTGDFYQRHAQAAALNYEVHVIYVQRYDALNKLQHTIKKTNQLTEEVVLYKPLLHWLPVFSKLVSLFYWLYWYNRCINNYIKTQGKPKVIHIKGAWKCGLLGVWFKHQQNIPYVISEQYTAYFKEAEHLFPQKNWVQKKILHSIFTHAKMVYPVSSYLGERLKTLFGIQYEVLTNIIDTQIFKPLSISNRNNVFTILHVSLLNAQKNPTLIFTTLEKLQAQKIDFLFQLICPENEYRYFIEQYPHLHKQVQWIAETDQQQLATYMQQADVFFFPSLFESFGLVTYEALACGTPVVIADIAVYKDIFNECEFVQTCSLNNADSFVDALLAIHQQKISLDKEKMWFWVNDRFSVTKVSAEIDSLYQQLNISGNKINQCHNGQNNI